MSRSVANKAVEITLREKLISEGYTLNTPRQNGETGVDILASRNGEMWHIEAIGYSKQGEARSRAFYEAFFRVISRLKDGATRLILALPNEFEYGMKQRAAHYGEAWDRIAKAFPELEIWFVDCSSRTVRPTSWGEWLEPR